MDPQKRLDLPPDLLLPHLSPLHLRNLRNSWRRPRREREVRQRQQKPGPVPAGGSGLGDRDSGERSKKLHAEDGADDEDCGPGE